MSLGKEQNGATQILQFIAPTEKNGVTQLYAYDPKHTYHKTSAEDIYLSIDYEMQLGTEVDCVFLAFPVTSNLRRTPFEKRI